MIPATERQDYEYFKTYTAKYECPVNIAWSDAFAGASAWLTDREISRLDTEKSSDPELGQFNGSSKGLGRL